MGLYNKIEEKINSLSQAELRTALLGCVAEYDNNTGDISTSRDVDSSLDVLNSYLNQAPRILREFKESCEEFDEQEETCEEQE